LIILNAKKMTALLSGKNLLPKAQVLYNSS
jgi:hypothetical protein